MKKKSTEKGFSEIEDLSFMYKPNLNIDNADGVLGLVKGMYPYVCQLCYAVFRFKSTKLFPESNCAYRDVR